MVADSIFNRLAGRYGACIGIPAAIYLFAQMPGKFSTVWVWKCHSDFGIAILGFAKAASRGDAEALRLAYPNHAKYRKEAYD